MEESFYVPLDGTPGSPVSRWHSTVHTTGPWDIRFQHGGPPSALLARAVERCAPRQEMIVARVTVELLGPVPVGELALRASVVRPGRSVELVEAVLSADGRDVARALAWRVLRTSASIASTTPSDEGGREVRPPALPEHPSTFEREAWMEGYLAAVEWRLVSGAFTRPGPATAWTRLLHPLVLGEELSPLQRVLAVADSGSGLSSGLDIARWQFINPELTVHVHREAIGEWICVDAQTAISPAGAGLATTVLLDQQGRLGVGAQSLLVAPRG